MKALAVIPARLASTRLPRKMLREIAGRPLIGWVYEAVRASPLLDDVIVATDSQEILEVCQRRGWRAQMTSPSRRSGTERVHEIARLIDTINTTIQRGGSMLIPTFALGRMQEILAVVHDARKFGRLVDCPIYASGLGVDLCDYYDDIARKTKQVDFSRQILKDLKIRPLPRKLKPGELPAED